jgi:hypothetical protein
MMRNKPPKCALSFPTPLLPLALGLPIANLVEELVELVLPDVVVLLDGAVVDEF